MMPSPVIETLAALVRINSINPAYENGCPEAAVADYCREFFDHAGIRTHQQEVFPGRPNLIAVLPGRQPGRRLIFEAHTDTAGIAGMTIPPFEPSLSGGRLYGRGACDVKAGLAAMMHALAAVRRDGQPPPCDVWVVAAADEEFSYRGVVKLCQGLEAAAAVVAEPTAMRLVSASKGCVRWRIVCHGVAAHSSRPELGLNAISDMARVVLALEQDARRLAQTVHPLVGPPTLNVGIIAGGTQINIVPERCVIEIDRRLVPDERIDDVLAHYSRLLDGLGVRASMEPPMLTDFPLETPPDSPIVSVAAEALREMGLPAAACGVPFGSDASKLAAAGVPAIVVGPGSIDQAHGAVEYVDCQQVEQAVEFYRAVMRRFE
ncbi:MAG: M20/M25/M40 family metallo-hydrolase [Acidobacteria bacterium]|nr:M20/M25/M40 family metallo-hydrolase [Acidobacteriota bacterium]